MGGWTMVRRAGLAAGLVGLLGSSAAFGAGPAIVADTPSILVDGEAIATVVPDTAVLTLGVEAQRPSAAEATNAVAGAATALRATLAAQGIQPADIATAAVSLDPVYPDQEPRPEPRKPQAPAAFRAGTLFHVTVTPVDRTGPLLSSLVQAGATTVDGIGFAATTAGPKRDALRADALRDARHKAEVYAAAAGLRLGPVIEITPGHEGEAAPPVMMRAAMAAKADTMPVEPGTLTLRASVSVRWALVP